MSQWQEMGMLLRAFNVSHQSPTACRLEFLSSWGNYHHLLFPCHQLPLSVSSTQQLSFMESGKDCNCALLKRSILSFKEHKQQNARRYLSLVLTNK